MIRNVVDPPAAVRKHELSREARILLCKTIAATIRSRNRLNLESAIELGDHLLQLKPTCRRGEWRLLLAEIGVNPTSAWECIAFAKYSPREHLEDCGSITEARALLKLGDGEEQEIGEEQQETQYDAFPEDEHVVEGMTPTEEEQEEPAKPKVYCDACQRCIRVGQQRPKRCKACKEARKAAKEFTKPLPKSPTGGFSLLVVMSHCKAIVRHLDNLCKDQGYLDEKGLPARPPWMEEIVVALREKYEGLKAKVKELREQAKANQGQHK
jgi:hypothetical protein